MTATVQIAPAGKSLAKFIYPTQESGQMGRDEFQRFAADSQQPLLLDDEMGVITDEGVIRDFTVGERHQLGIKSFLEDPDAEAHFWRKAEEQNGLERTLYGKDESCPLRERVFTREADAEAFRASLIETHIPFLCL